MTSKVTVERLASNQKVSSMPLMESSLATLLFPSNVYRSISRSYNWSLSTEENFRSQESQVFYGKFKHIRQRLDYKYHAHYSGTRQLMQDSIIESLLFAGYEFPDSAKEHTEQVRHFIIFTAGCMGAGKTHTIRELSSNGKFPVKVFISVDPDEIRRLLPEYSSYIAENAETAGELTRKEAGMIAEILTEAALEKGRNVLVDGSLRDAAWYKNYFEHLRQSYPKLSLGIVHVTAPVEDIHVRVQQRAKSTGRIIPSNVLEECMEQVPRSVSLLRDHVDLFLEVHNATVSNSTKPEIIEQCLR